MDNTKSLPTEGLVRADQLFYCRLTGEKVQEGDYMKPRDLIREQLIRISALVLSSWFHEQNPKSVETLTERVEQHS